jgi:hypothetical protein
LSTVQLVNGSLCQQHGAPDFWFSGINFSELRVAVALSLREPTWSLLGGNG